MKNEAPPSPRSLVVPTDGIGHIKGVGMSLVISLCLMMMVVVKCSNNNFDPATWVAVVVVCT
jgi:hypothetical protein